ncbi:MAG: hypothetical protein ACE5JS_17925, partial [Nitrospinota bacterium]
LDSIGCPGGRKRVSKEEANRCNPLYDAYNRRVDAINSRRAVLRRREKKIDDRMKALEAAYKKAWAPVAARHKKYNAEKKAYLGARKTWEGRVSQIFAKVNALIGLSRKETAKAKQEEAARREAAKKLRGQVKGIQEALRRLNRSMQGDAAERAQWERATNEAMQNAWNRGKGMILDESLGFLSNRLEKQLKSANEQVQRAVVRLSAETDPNRRERLHAAIKLLGQQRDEIKRAKTLVTDRLEDAKKITDAVDYATSNPGDLEKSLRGTYEVVKTTLGDPKVQKALKIGGKFAAGAGYAQSIADSSYDIATEVVSWRRINQLNRNSEAYLKAVGRMKERMEKTMKKIHKLEGKKK